MSTGAAAEEITDSTMSVPKQVDTFGSWLEAQKVPVVRGFFIADINTVELGDWDLLGARAAFVLLEGTGGTNDGYICEIPPAKKTNVLHHMYEEMVYVTQGHGVTTVWQKGGRKHNFEWGPGSLFAIPLNAHYQHFNSSGVEPARYYAVTNRCFVMNLFHNVDYVFNSDYVFADRFEPEAADYFSGEGKVQDRLFMTTNFVPNVLTMGLRDYSARGKGSSNIKFNLAEQTMGAHISQFPVGTYKKCHRHGPGAHVIILSGQGYSNMWPAGQQPMRIEWKPGSVVVPPDQWYHQHFNSGAVPARYLALRWNNWRFKSLMWTHARTTFTSVKEGGTQIDFDEEDPAIHLEFVAALEKAGAECKMCDYYPKCPKKAAAQASAR